MARRLQKTLIDYMVIAISPALIMALVGSLVFFLLTVFYQGQYATRLTFIFAMFVMAAVLVGRISIEEGIEYATFFAVPLGVVTLLATYRFVEFQGALAGWSWLINIGLITIVWWCAHKLTWDCTVIVEHEDASDKGLLESLGLDERREMVNAPTVESGPAPAALAEDAAAEAKTSWWQRFVQRRRRRHVPGVWVIYFSLAALPLFGFGQRFIPRSDAANRLYAFQLFFVYVLAALGLLLTTSFLGLRRYLRQRRLEMPADTAAVWLGVGSSMIVALLILCSLLPRPSPEYALAQLPFAVGSPGDLQSSRYGMGNDGPSDDEFARRSRPDHERASGEDESRSREVKTDEQGGRSTESDSGETDDSTDHAEPQAGDRGDRTSDLHDESRREGDSSADNAPQRNRQQQGRDDSETEDSETEDDGVHQPMNDTASQGRQEDASDDVQNRTSAKPDQRDADEPQRDSKPSRQLRSADRTDATRPVPRRSISPPAFLEGLGWGVAGLFKLLLYAALLAAAAYLLWVHWDRVVASVCKFLDEVRQFFRRLFGSPERPGDEEHDEPAPHKPVPRPFSSFSDPFASGVAERIRPEELVRYTFEALEAWARERGNSRQPDQTALEFAARLGRGQPTLHRDAVRLAELYSTVAYAEDALSTDSVNQVRAVWRHFRRP